MRPPKVLIVFIMTEEVIPTALELGISQNLSIVVLSINRAHAVARLRQYDEIDHGDRWGV